MLWILPYFGYAFAASALASAAGYAAVTRFSVVQRVLAVALDRALKRISKNIDGSFEKYTVEHTETGVIATTVVLGTAAIHAAKLKGTQVVAVSVQRLEVDFPSFSRPMTVHIRGVRANLQQMQIPDHVLHGDISVAERRRNREDKIHRLEIVEELLWGRDASGTASARRWNPAGAYLGRLQAKALQKTVAFVAQFVQLEATDVEVQYTQVGEPGPRPSCNYLQGADAAVLHLRALCLDPQGTAASHLKGDVEDTQQLTRIDPASPMSSPRDQGAAASDEPSWWQALVAIPHLLWSHVITTRPSATKLSVSGVSMVLKTYPSTWKGYHAAAKPAAPFAFSAGIRGHRDHTSPGKRRRQTATVDSSNLQWQQPSSGPGSSSTEKNRTTPAPATSMGVPWIDQAAALRHVKAEEHILFRQWEMSVMLCLLPPGYESIEEVTLTTMQARSVPASAAPISVEQPSPAGGNAPLPPFRQSFEELEQNESSPSPFESHENGDEFAGCGLEHIFSGGVEEEVHDDDLMLPSMESLVLERPTISDVESEYGTPTASLSASRRSSRDPSPIRSIEIPNNKNGTEAAEAASSLAGTASLAGTTPTQMQSNNAPKRQRRAPASASKVKEKYVLDVSISLKALVAELNVASIAILTRIVDREMHLAHYGPLWAVRPNTAVEGNESEWWRHAGRALAAGVRRAARREVPLNKIALRRTLRLEYQSLYAGKHTSNSLFQDPGRRWYHLRRIRTIDEGAKERLKALEDQLSLEELAHFRLGIAVRYNRHLAEDPMLTHFVADKIDALVCTRREGVPPSFEDLLLHRDRQAGVGASASPTHGDGVLFGLHVSITCPKLGTAIDMRCSSRGKYEEGVEFVVLSLHGVTADLSTDATVTLQVAGLQCGPAERPTAQVEPRILSCPSTVCERVCRAAEFFRYAMTGSVLSESVTHRADVCARVTVSPRWGEGGLVVGGEISAGGEVDNLLRDWHPAGFDVAVQFAAVGLVYSAEVAEAMLSFADACDHCKTQPWRWSLPPESSQEDPGELICPWPPPLLQHPESVGCMVASTFAAAQMPTLGSLVLPSTNLEIQCPGVAVQLPYNHRNRQEVFKHKGKKHITRTLHGSVSKIDEEVSSASATTADVRGRRFSNTPTSSTTRKSVAPGVEGRSSAVDQSSDELPPEGLLYMFTVTIQNIRVRITGEDFALALRGGTARRIEAEGHLDAFSYMSQAARRLVARRVLPGRVVFDPTRRAFIEEVSGVELMEGQLQEIEIACMAKVWAYPEDMPAIMRAIRDRGSEEGATFSYLSRSMSSARLSYSKGADAASGLAQVMPALLGNPDEYPVPLIPFLKAGAIRASMAQRLTAAPGEPGGAVSAAGVSINGVQAWVSPMHVWHMVSLEAKVRQMYKYLLGSPIVESVAAERKAVAAVTQTIPELPVPRPSRRLLFTLEVDEVSLLWLIGTWTSKDEALGTRTPSDRARYSRAWGITVKPCDPAYLWAQWLAPVYSASLARISAAIRLQANGAMAAAASIDGIILRDLQLPDIAKHAYVLRPLPARARRLNSWLQSIRRGILGITETSPARQLWQRAFSKILLRQKTSSVKMGLDLLESEHHSGHKAQSAILGPQIIVRYTSSVPVPPGGQPSPARPQAELTAEIGQMLAYVRVKQQSSMTAFATQLMQLMRVVATDNSPQNPIPAAKARPAGMSLQSSLRIDVVIVGIDVLFRVQSQDLMSLKLQQGRVTMDRKAVTRTSLPKDIRLHVSAMVQDIVLRDMKAAPEHALVVIPNSGADYCSFSTTYVVLVDARRFAPCLNLILQNPRILLLFRFVADIMSAVDIVGSAVTHTKAAGGQPVPVPAAEPATGANSAASEALQASKPLEVVLQLENVGIIVPTGTTTRTVLSGEIEHLMLAAPGSALPRELLERSQLPTMEQMLEESLLSNMTFKFSGFHDAPPGPTTPVPKAVSPTEAEKEAEARAGSNAATKDKWEDEYNEKLPTIGTEEGLDTCNTTSKGIKRGGIFASGLRPREEGREAGVLFFEEEEDASRSQPVGVLHLPPDVHPAAGAIGGGDLEDNILAGPGAVAKGVLGAAKRLVDNVIDTFDREDGGDGRQSRVGVIIEKQTRPESRESTAGGSVVTGEARKGGKGSAKPALPLNATGADDRPDDLASGVDLPRATFLLCVEQFSVTTGTLVRVPNFFRRGSPIVQNTALRPQGSFIPPSLSSFSWPSEVFDVVPRGPLLHPANFSMVSFSRRYGTSCVTSPQLHFSCTPLSAILSAPNYTTIMDFVYSNLNDFLSPPDAPPPATPKKPHEVRFNPAMKFGPALGAVATFRLTVAVPKVSVVLEAHPREWMDPNPSYTFTSAAESHALRPFFHASASNVLMDMGNMPPGATFITFCATSLDLQDLRLGYRLSEVSSLVPGDVSYEVQEMEGLETTDSAPASMREMRAGPSFPDLDEAGFVRQFGESTYASPTGSLNSPVSWASGSEATPRTPSFDFNHSNNMLSEGHPTPGMGPSGQSSTHAHFGGAGGRFASSSGAPDTNIQQAPHTGILLSVARRLSEHSQRNRSIFMDNDSQTPGAHGAPTPGRTVSGDAPRHFLPLLDFVALPDVLPSLGSEAASLRVLTAPHHAPAEERLPGATNTRLPGSNPNVRLEVSVAILEDSTTAVEVGLSSALLQWPYFKDLSLIWSVANVFKSVPPGEREQVNDDVPVVKESPPAPGPSSWLYFNVILTETEIFVPVLDVEVAEHMAAELWGGTGIGSHDLEGGSTPASSDTPRHPQPKNEFQRVADLALATMLLDSTGRPETLSLEERGIALSSSAIRVAYSAGGDGESVIQVDLRELAIFIRDPRARINCILQPFSCSAEVHTQVPQAAEHIEISRLHRAAGLIQRQWRKVLQVRKLREQSTMTDAVLPSAASLAFGTVRRSSVSRTVSGDEMGSGHQWVLVDDLIMDVASPHTRSLLAKYKRTSRDESALLHLSQFRALSTRRVHIRAGALTARAAFSHIPFWQAAVDGVRRIVLAPDTGSDSSAPSSPNKVGGSGSAGARPFQPESLQIAASVESAELVLCNDKPETFGAPDVLQYSMTEANLSYDSATVLPDRPSYKVGRLALSTYASFLNSGTSRWEPLYDLWPVTAEYVDMSSSTYVSDRKTNLWISSDRNLNATVNPASLMSFGDALAFLRAFDDRTTMDDPSTPLTRSASHENHLFSASAPADRTQVAASVTSRAPQKYLIQNQSGMKLYYWAEAVATSATGRSPVFTLDNGGSETLRVAPSSKRLNFLQLTAAAAGTERQSSVISMHFEGNWMPMRDVAVNVVGKYRYWMVSPADNTAVPVLIDIILVGRTKIITVHSGIWVENCIERPISLRLHVPTTSLVPPASLMAGASSSGSSPESGGAVDSDLAIGPLAPKSGCYLPLTAALGGLLFVQPEGYMEASRDVIRLSSKVDELLCQQGYITCDPFTLPGGPETTLHMAMEATPSRVLSEFQAFKHMECVVVGTIQRAATPLEVTLSIQPTMVISNALPYEMRVLLWQVAPPETSSTPPATQKQVGRGTKRKAKMGPVPAQTPGTHHPATFLEMLSPRTSMAVPVPKRGAFGRYFCYSISPGGEQDIYVDMRQNVLMHVSVEEINMRSVKWSLCSWAQRNFGRGDARETQYAARLPKDVELRMVGVGMPLPTDTFAVSAYLLRLKDAAGHLRAVHAQFNRDARAAMTSDDIKNAVRKVKTAFMRIVKTGSKQFVPSGGQETSRRAPIPTSARPVPAKGDRPPMMSPPPADGSNSREEDISDTIAPEAVKKRKISLLQRFTGSKGAQGHEEKVGEEGRPISASSTGTAASPARQLLPSRTQSSDAPQREIEVVPAATTSPEMETLVEKMETTGASGSSAGWLAPAPPPMENKRALLPRPPPLEISEEPLVTNDEEIGLTSTPFDVWTRDDRRTAATTAASPSEDEEESEVRAPPVLHVGVYNSLADQERHQAGVSRITLYVPSWMNNRTGVDLFYQDKASAPHHPILLGHSVPWDFGEVFTPGTSMTDAFDKEGDNTAPFNPNSSSSSTPIPPPSETEKHAVLEYKLVLMNKQEEMALGLAHVRHRRYAQPINIKTVGNKGTVELRGPPAREPSVPQRLVKGIKGVAVAGAGVPLSAVERVRQLRTDQPSAPGNSKEEEEPTPHVSDLEAAHVHAREESVLSMSRRSVDVVSKHPGTMLVRISSGHVSHPERQLPSVRRHREGSSLQHGITPMSGIREEDAAAALEAMQKVPAPREDEENIEESQAPIRQQLSEELIDSASASPLHPSENENPEPEKPCEDVASFNTRERFKTADVGEQLCDEAAATILPVERRRTPVTTKGQRLFEFAVDVTAGPPDSIYRHTKLVTLKPKYIIENQTGLSVDVKQLNGQLPEGNYNPAPSCRFARTLAPGQRAAVYWDDADLPKELVVRPRLPGEELDAWHWSGGFPIPDTEWYFGLRIRHREGHQRYLNIPVNVTVGSSGSVQVTLKSPASVPPYRIENMCKDVQLYMVQVPLVFREEGKLYVDSLQPGDVMPYAWDEPTMLTKLRVQAKVSGRSTESRVADFSLDTLGDTPMMMLPTHGEPGAHGGTARRLYRTLSTDLPDELKKKLVSLLAAEFSKKVYVSVYADGPTRVLRFSDEKNMSSLEQQNVVLDLAARLKEVELQLRSVNGQFARLSGASGAHGYGLDLYGRLPAPKDDQAVNARSTLQRRTSRRLPLPEATQALVHLASRNIESRHCRGASLSQSPSQVDLAAPRLLGSRQNSAALRGASPALSDAKERQTVRFFKNVSFSDGVGQGQEPAAAQRRPAAGVLQIDEPELECASDGSKPPYNHLIIRTGSERPSASVARGNDVAADAGVFGADVSDVQDKRPTIGGSRPLRRAESRDWGHIRSNPVKEAGSRAMGVSSAGPAGGSGGAGGSGSTGSTAAALAHRQELLKLMSDSDAVLLIGGDLNVTVVQAQGLSGLAHTTHSFARVHVRAPVPTPGDQHRSKQTSVVWQSTDPLWDEQLLFREVCAASELVVEVWDLGATRSSDQLNALTANPAEVIKSCRFLGRAEVPLGETLDVPAGTPLWFPLMRRSASDTVSGQLQLRFLWDVTARGLLTIKLAALEQVLAQRREILAALQPISVQTALHWTKLDPGVSSVAAAAAENINPSAVVPESPNKVGGGAGKGVWSARPDAGSSMFALTSEHGGLAFPVSRTSTQVLARHSQDHRQRHLIVTVLEARGLNPRRGVVVALSDNELPNPVVTLEVPGYPPYVTPVRPHTLNPQWPANQRHILRGVDSSRAAITVRLGDRRSGLRQTVAPLGVGAIHASNIRGENPVYVWVPLHRPGRRRRLDDDPEGNGVPELHVFLRLQWQTEVVRGSSIKVEIDAAGAGLMVVGGLQDEIFNLTFDTIKASAVRTRHELTVSGTVSRVQLDNQLLNAVEPVVLAPDASARLAGSENEGPLVTFGFVRSFAGSQVASLPGGTATVSAAEHLSGEASASSVDLGAAEAPCDGYGIRSFKNIRLTIAPLDFTTDEDFLEALLSFVTSLPTADIWQDKTWQGQQRRLLTAQFGPREVESLAINAVIVPPAPAGGGVASSVLAGSTASGVDGYNSNGVDRLPALSWVLEKEARDLEALHGQSDLSSWFFIENAEVGTMTVNVTVSLTSRLLAAGQSLAAGAFNRALGASGYQLVNVSNVPITLGHWVVGNNPSIRGRFSNGFLSQRALASNLRRHYTFQALKEAHKVLGGAGPAVASVPLTVLWASGSTYVLLKQVTTGKASVVGTAQQVFYVPFMTFSMFVSAFSRMLAAGMAVIPPERLNGDDETLRRIIRRPQNSLEALAGAPKELIWGVRQALRGFALDPVAGWHAYHIPGFVFGLAKGTVGLPVRPLIGSLEFTSKALAAVAMSALGRDGIVGKVQRRVRAPGAFADDGTDAMEAGPRSEAQVHARALQAAWQRVLPEFFPTMAEDSVSDVINVRATRVVLITDRHVAYLRARHLREHSVYKAKWLVPIAEIQNIIGDPETRKITINHVHRYNLKIFGVWPVKKRKGLRAGPRAMYERTILRLTKVQQAVQSGGALEEAQRKAFEGTNMTELTILSAPYVAPALLPPGSLTRGLGGRLGAASRSQESDPGGEVA